MTEDSETLGADEPISATSTASTTPSRRRFLQTSAALGALTVGANQSLAATVGADESLPKLHREGNSIVDETGQEVLLHGVNIADPGEQSRPWRGQTAPETFELATDESEGWYTNVVRVPVQPEFIAARTRAPQPSEMPHGDDWGPTIPGQFDADDVEWYCEAYLDELVELGASRGAYVMIDYHRHYPVFHQEDHKNHGVPNDVWQCSATGGEDWRNPEVCGERGVLWHGEDQVDEIWSLIEDQNILEAYDLDEDDIYLEPPEVTNALDEELHTFWEVVADRYASDHHVIFDVYNEPTGPYGGDWGGPERQAGELSLPEAPPGDGEYAVDQDEMKAWWDLWVERAQPWVDTVEEHAPGHLITIGSPRWSQYTYWAPENEFEAENMCYTGHVYTQDDMRPLSTYMGTPAEEVPVIFSEFGWIEGGGEHVETPWMDCSGEHDGDCEPYIEEYEQFIEEYDVHPLAWCFDHTWEPNMFEHGDPGPGGEPGAPDADDWMEYLNDETLGVWWHEFNQRYADDGEDTIQVGEYDTQDTTGSGLHNDFTGNGETTFEDVDAFADNLDNEAVQENQEAFDFAGNDRIGFSDILELLRKI